MTVLYAAVEPDKDDAIQLVKDRASLTAGDEVTGAYPISQATWTAMGKERGYCGML